MTFPANFQSMSAHEALRFDAAVGWAIELTGRRIRHFRQFGGRPFVVPCLNDNSLHHASSSEPNAHCPAVSVSFLHEDEVTDV